MGTNWLVATIVLGTFVIWIWLDVILGWIPGAPTESQWIANVGQKFVIFPFIVGFLCGHWFFNHKYLNYSAWMYVLPIWAALVGWDIWWTCFRFGKRVWYRWAPIWFLLGIPVGMFLWGQGDGSAPF